MLTRRSFLLASAISGVSVALWSPDAEAASLGSVAVSAARSQIGVPYRWRGAEPGDGFDCSGLTMWAWAQAGVGLNHSSYDQAVMFQAVNPNNLLLGDLVFNESRGHVVMFSGNGMGISAPRSGEQVREATLASVAHCVRPTLRAGAATPVSAKGATHVVAPGETLSVLASRNGTTVNRLMQLNGLQNPDRLLVGQTLRLS